MNLRQQFAGECHVIAVLKQPESLIRAQDEADVVWFLVRSYAKIDCC
jgi:hypothetical protein